MRRATPWRNWVPALALGLAALSGCWGGGQRVTPAAPPARPGAAGATTDGPVDVAAANALVAQLRSDLRAELKGFDLSGDTNFGWAGLGVAALFAGVCIVLALAQRRTLARLAAEHGREVARLVSEHRGQMAAAAAAHEQTVRHLAALLELDERGDQAQAAGAQLGPLAGHVTRPENLQR